jgi:hypothetical protein
MAYVFIDQATAGQPKHSCREAVLLYDKTQGILLNEIKVKALNMS